MIYKFPKNVISASYMYVQNVHLVADMYIFKANIAKKFASLKQKKKNFTSTNLQY